MDIYDYNFLLPPGREHSVVQHESPSISLQQHSFMSCGLAQLHVLGMLVRPGDIFTSQYNFYYNFYKLSIVICKEIYISFTFISKSAPLHSTKGPASSMGIEKSEWTTPFQVTTIWIIGSPCRSTIIIVCSKENSSA